MQPIELEQPTWREHISYKWHLLRYATSKKYRLDCDRFEQEIQLAFKKGLLK